MRVLENPADPLTVAALRAAALRQTMTANYVGVLDALVFNVPDVTGKDRVKYQRLLASEEASTVLGIVWKESEFVSGTELSKAGYESKAFPTGIACHALGVMLAGDKTEVAATVTRIRNIVMAGCAYGLVCREKAHAKLVLVRCTPLLHEVMLKLGELNAGAVRRHPQAPDKTARPWQPPRPLHAPDRRL